MSILASLTLDVRCAARTLAAHARFTALVVATLALTIGAGTAVFSIANAVLLRPLPYSASDRLVLLKSVREPSALEQRASYPDFRDWRTQTRSLDLVGHGGVESVLTGAGDPERLRAEMFIGDLFGLLGVAPALGAVAPEAGAGPSAVLSHALWQRAFGADPGIVGKSITLDGNPVTVAAVMPAGFEYPIARNVDLWLPLARFNPALAENRNARLIDVIGRLRPGVSLDEAQADLDVIAADLAAQYPDTNRKLRVRLKPALEEVTGGVARGVALLCGAVAALLLIGCVNVASLLLARTISRERELATRAALGASRARIARQLMLESLLLAAIGGLAGMLLAAWLVGAAGSWLTPILPRAGEIAAARDTVVIALVLALGSAVLFGFAPAYGAARAASKRGLTEGAHGASRAARGTRAFAALVFAEMTLATVLLAGGGAFVQSFLKLDRNERGFDPRNVLTFELSLPSRKYSDPAEAFARLRARLLEIPGVLAASTGLQLPDRGEALLDDTAPFAQIEGRPLPAGERPRVASLAVQPGFLRALGIPLVGGRDFGDGDDARALRVAIVNRSFVEAYLGGENAVGSRLRLDSWTLPGDSAAEIVGVAADVRHEGLRSAAEPMVYLPFAQRPRWSTPLVVKTNRDPLALVPAVRAAVRELDAEQPLDDIGTLEHRLAGSLAQDRFRAALLGAFSVAALALAAFGLFAVLSYTTEWRVREIGIRMALGARAADVATAVVRQGLLPVAAGALVGATAAAALYRLVRSMLFEVAAADAAAVGAAVAILLAVAALAAAVPARRAASVDPAAALRGE